MGVSSETSRLSPSMSSNFNQFFSSHIQQSLKQSSSDLIFLGVWKINQAETTIKTKKTNYFRSYNLLIIDPYCKIILINLQNVFSFAQLQEHFLFNKTYNFLFNYNTQSFPRYKEQKERFKKNCFIWNILRLVKSSQRCAPGLSAGVTAFCNIYQRLR